MHRRMCRADASRWITNVKMSVSSNSIETLGVPDRKVTTRAQQYAVAASRRLRARLWSGVEDNSARRLCFIQTPEYQSKTCEQIQFLLIGDTAVRS